MTPGEAKRDIRLKIEYVCTSGHLLYVQRWIKGNHREDWEDTQQKVCVKCKPSKTMVRTGRYWGLTKRHEHPCKSNGQFV